MATPPVFIERNIAQMRADYYERYEQLTGKPLNPAQPEALQFEMMIYREAVKAQQIQQVGESNLVAFAPSAPILERIGENVGVSRIPGTEAKVDVYFRNADPGDPIGEPIIIPVGTRIVDVTGATTFEVITEVDLTPLTADPNASVMTTVECTEPGRKFFADDRVTVLVDVPFGGEKLALNSIENSLQAGSDPESDDQLRARIPLALDGYSVAGSKGSYRFFALSANAKVREAIVQNPIPGTVRVTVISTDFYDLAGDQTTVKDDVLAMLSDEFVRPICDTVEVVDPTVSNYTIEVSVTWVPGADQVNGMPLVEARLAAFLESIRYSLGRHVTLSDIIDACKVDGVYEVSVTQPPSAVTVDPNGIAVCDATSVANGGTAY